MLILIGLLLALGAVAATVVRTGPGLARAAAVIAMVAVAIATIVPPRSESEQLPAQLGVACSNDGAADGVAAALVPLAASAGATVHLAHDAALPAALAHAALLAGPRREELLAVWNGSLVPQPLLPAAVAGTAYTTAPPLPFEPASVHLQAVGAPLAERPLQLLASIAGSAVPVAATVTIALDGATAREFDVALPTVGAARVDAGVATAGTLTAAIEIAHGRHLLRARGTAAVAAPLPLLVLERGGTVAAALAAQGVLVTTAAALPADLGEVAAIALGVPLATAEQRRLLAAIGDGLGVFAFGPGLQQEGEPLRDVWPVRLRPSMASTARASRRDTKPETAPPEPPPPEPTVPPTEPPRVDPDGPVEVDRHAIAMVFVVDRSGSMGQHVVGGATKMSFVKTSADRTAAALETGDQVGVVTFGDPDQGRLVLPLTPVTDRAAVASGIGQLAHANEGTFLLGGLRVAQTMLAANAAAVRHVVVLTDGEYMANEQFALRAVAREMATAGITVSVLAIVDGGTDSEFHGNCELLARDGGGVFLPVADATKVPQFVSAEVVRTMGRLGRRPADTQGGSGPVANALQPQAVEPDAAPLPPNDADADVTPAPRALAVRAVADSPLLLPLPAPWPELGAAYAATAGFDAHVLLVAGDEGLPLLAFANRGLGRVGTFAAELVGDGGQAFVREAGFPARLSQWIHAVTRAVPTLPVDLLSERAVTPPAPTPAEVAQLRAATGSEPLPFAALQVPPPRTALRWRSQVPRFAALAVGVLCLLVLLEWACARRSG